MADNVLNLMRQASAENRPICSSPLPNGVIIVYMPQGGNRNLRNQEAANQWIEKNSS